MREPDTQGDSSLAVAEKSSEQVESARASEELSSAATLVGATDMSGVESDQSMLDSESANAIADSNIDNSTIK